MYILCSDIFFISLILLQEKMFRIVFLIRFFSIPLEIFWGNTFVFPSLFLIRLLKKAFVIQN